MRRQISVALYVRRSTGEKTQRDSLRVQEELLRGYADEHHLKVVAVFADSGSGTSLRHRPEFRRMARTIERGCGFTIVLCRDVSRFGRFPDPDEAAYWQFHFSRNRVSVVYVEEQILGEGTPIEGFTLAVKRVMAGEFSRDKSRMVSYGQERVTRMGFLRGGPAPYGMRRWLVKDGTPVQPLAPGEWKALTLARTTLRLGDPSEVAVVRRIFNEFADGHTRQQIARDLNAEAIRSPRGGIWYLGTVGAICSNPAYVGSSTFRRRINPKKKPIIDTPNSYEAVVSRDLWNAVQDRIERQTSRRTDRALAMDLRAAYLTDGVIQYKTPARMAVPCSFETVRNRFSGGIADALHLAFEAELDDATASAVASLHAVLCDRHMLLVEGISRVAVRLGFPAKTRWGQTSDFGRVPKGADVMVGVRMSGDEAVAYVVKWRPRGGWPRRLRTAKDRGDCARIEDAALRVRRWVYAGSDGAEAEFLRVVRSQPMVNLSAAARELGWRLHIVRAMYHRLLKTAVMPPLKYVRGRKLTIACESCGVRREVAPNRAVALRSSRCRECTRKRGINKVRVTCPRCGRKTMRWPSAVARLAAGCRTPCRRCDNN